jgi:hypothetical protein
MDIETVIGRFRGPPRSASYDCRHRRLRAAWRRCWPGEAGHDARRNLSLKQRARSAVLSPVHVSRRARLRLADLDDMRVICAVGRLNGA